MPDKPSAEFLRTLRFITQQPTSADLAWWRQHAGSARPPKPTQSAGKRFIRNLYLKLAFNLLNQDVAELLSTWEVFASRGPYKHWSDDDAPPEGAVLLQVCLFQATKKNGGDTLCAKHLAAIVGKKFNE